MVEALVTISVPAEVRSWLTVTPLSRKATPPYRLLESTDTDGAVALPRTLRSIAEKDPCYLWVSHDGYRASWVRLEAEHFNDGALLAVELVEEPGVACSVIDIGEGEPIAVTLVQTAPDDHSHFYASFDEGLDGHPTADALSAYVRTFQATTSGPASLPSIGVATRLEAHSLSHASEHRFVEPWRRTVQLTLHPVFYLRGSASCPSGFESEQMELVVDSMSGDEHALVFERMIPAQDSFGPFTIALPPNEGLLISLRNACGSTSGVELLDVSPGDVHDVSFEPQDVPSSWFRVVDPEGEPIEGAFVSAAWWWSESHLSDGALTNDDGYAKLEGVGSEEVFVSVVHSQYARSSSILLSAWLPREDAPVITVGPGRTVHGTVLHEGAPVEEFTVFAWSEDPSKAIQYGFRDCPTGTFQLTSIPTQRVSILASGPGVGPSDVVIVPSGDDAPSNLLLHCNRVAPQIIRAIDSTSGTPIENARVMVRPSIRGFAKDSVRPSSYSDAHGEVLFNDFPITRTFLSVSSDGYTERLLSLPAAHGSRAPILVALDRMQPMRVQLEPWPHESWEDAWVRIDGSVSTEYELVDAEGRVQLGDVHVGELDLYVVFDDNSLLHRRHRVHAGRPSDVVIDIASERGIVVEFETEDSIGHQSHICEYAAAGKDFHHFNLRTFLDKDGLATLRGLPPGPGLVRIATIDETVLAEAPITRADVDRRNIVLRPDARTTVTRVLGADGAPVENAIAYALPENTPYSLTAWAYTDAEGVARLARNGPARDRVLATLGAAHSAVVFHEASDDETIELRLRAPVPVTTVAPRVSAGRAVVACRVHLSDFPLWIEDATTGAPVELSPGPYRIELATPGLWLDHDRIEVPPAGGTVELPVRETGALRVVPPPAGAPQVAALEIVDELTGERVTDWVSASRVLIEQVGVATEYRGVPTGTYSWSARLTDGSARAGNVEVAVASTTDLSVGE